MEKLIAKYGAASDANGSFSTLRETFDNYGGLEFSQGLFRIYSEAQAKHVSEIIANSGVALAARFDVVAGDWLGRVWGWNRGIVPNGAHVSVLDPTSGDEFEIPGMLEDLFDSVLVEGGDAALEVDAYREWRRGDSGPLDWRTCVSMIVPYELSGELAPGNLEREDLSVHWGLSLQIASKVSEIEAGTRIEFSISDSTKEVGGEP